jgi:DNA-binding IscR family transcriptional regulator
MPPVRFVRIAWPTITAQSLQPDPDLRSARFRFWTVQPNRRRGEGVLALGVALGQTGWVETVRGRNGGMRLAADPRALKLDTIVRRLEADFALVECLGENNRCGLGGGCALEVALVRPTEAFLRELGRVSLADLVSGSPALEKLALGQPLTRRRRSARASASRAPKPRAARRRSPLRHADFAPRLRIHPSAFARASRRCFG